MKHLRLVVAVLPLSFVVVNATGCRRSFSFNAPAVPPEINNTGDYETKTDASDKLSYQNALNAYNDALCGKDTEKVSCDFADASTDSKRLEKAKLLRNDIVFNLLGDIDKVYGEYVIRLNSGKGTEAFAADSLTLGLSSAATVATHAATKTLLSAIGTGITGAGQSFDKNFFAQQTFAVIATAMQTRRDKVRGVIAANLRDQDVIAYPLSAARRDLVQYYYAGTLSGGLQELQEEAGNATRPRTTMVASTPTITPAGGTYKKPNPTDPITMTDTTPGATIYYTLDGSTPSTSSSIYTAPITLTLSDAQKTVSVHALAIADGYSNSAIGSATYTFDPNAPNVFPSTAGAPAAAAPAAPHSFLMPRATAH